MDALSVIAVGIWLTTLVFAGYRAYVWTRARFSPKYAAQRKLRVKEKRQRNDEKHKKREMTETERQRKWAEKHPENPTAKAILAEKSAPAATSSAEPDEDKLRVALRQRQAEDDEQTRRMEARKAAAALEAQQLLEWAKAHPETPEGHRHLMEVMMAADKTAEEVTRDIEFYSHFKREEGSLEAIEAATRQAERQARVTEARKTVADIQAILTALPYDQQ
jgi:hypothetical protein